MHLIINGEPAEVPTNTVAELLQYLGHKDKWFAVAVDGMHIPKQAWFDTRLHESQSVEILSPMQGG